MAPSAQSSPALHVGRPVRPDGFAAVCLVLAGLVAALPLVVEWVPTVAGRFSGWAWLLQVRADSDPSLPASIGAYGLLMVGLAGAALVLFGFGALLPVNHRPFGLASLMLTLGVLAVGAWWLLRTEPMIDQGARALLEAGIGWWSLPVCGVLALLGSLKALTSG